MCGIAGELRYEAGGQEANWEGISALMARRGPDDAGSWSDRGRCTLVFRRLAILDLTEQGHQPMVAGNGRYVIVFNGEVYNFVLLRQELESRGISFRSRGDTEVVLHALIEWGHEALNRFNGIFALGFYDSQEKRLLLARDHAGVKPLYYLRSPKGIVFASQYNQILAHPWAGNLQICPEALGLYLRLGYIPAPFAMLNDTHMLEPGAWAEFSADGSGRDGKYFQFPRYQTPTLSGHAAIEATNAAVTAAVKRQLVSDVPVGTFLSGGIDSPLVAAKMRATGHAAIRAFTIGTQEAVSDEAADAVAYARELGLDHVVHQVSADDALGILEDVIEACGEPFGDYSIFPTFVVSQLAGKQFKVMLSGDGGDELFWGYARRSGALLQHAIEFRQSHRRRKIRWAAHKLLGIGAMSYPARKYASLGEWQKTKHSRLSELWLGRIFPALPEFPRAYDAFDYSAWETDETAQWLRWNEFTSHLTMVLLKVDRASMYNSLEVRVPLLDREVIDVAARTDWRTCLDLKNMYGKLPLREALKRHVNHQTHAKRGFEVPMGTWLRTRLRPLFEDLVLGRDELLGLPIDEAALRALYDLHLSGKNDLSRGLWPLLNLSLWDDRHYCGSRTLSANN